MALRLATHPNAISTMASVCFLLSLSAIVRDATAGISCYVCQSVDGSDPDCADPFNSTYVPLIHDCGQGLAGHVGTLPARFCFKLKGRNRASGRQVLVRQCSVDTLVDSSQKTHCGSFAIRGSVNGVSTTDYFEGCVSMCRYDGCNGAEGQPRLGVGPLLIGWLGFLACLLLIG